MNKLLFLFVITLGVVGCDAMFTSNQIGYSMSYKKPMLVSCVRDALRRNQTFQEFLTINSGFAFVVNRYKATFIYSQTDQQLYAFELNIDGTFLGEDTGEFYRNADKISGDITRKLSEYCGQ